MAPGRWGRLWLEWRRPLTIAVGATIGFRLIVTWIALVSADGVNFPHIVARHPSELANILAQWDVGYYLTVAAHGYPGHAVGAAQTGNRAFYAFGPLYPALTRITHDVTGIGYVTSSELVSTVGLVVALAALWKLVDLEVGRRAADGACVMLLAWPSAFFLVATYPESVTLAAGTLAFLAVRRGHFVAAGVLAAAAAMGKYYLVLLLVPLAMEVWFAPRERDTWRAGRDLEWLSPPRVTAARLVGRRRPDRAGPRGVDRLPEGALRRVARLREVPGAVAPARELAVDVHRPCRLRPRALAAARHLDRVGHRALRSRHGAAARRRGRPGVPPHPPLLRRAPRPRVVRVHLPDDPSLREPRGRSCSSRSSPYWASGWHGTQWRERALLFLFLPCGYFLLERFVTGKFAG